MNRQKNIIIPVFFILFSFGVQSAKAEVVDLCNFPETNAEVPEFTVLADQWRSIGILFDANPATVNPIMRIWGVCHLFFDPDLYGVAAVFDFVVPGTTQPTSATSFVLRAWYSPNESAQLVGLDESDNVVAQDEITATDIGDESQTLEMSISGNFHSVEWRTQGNPGIAASHLEFELTGSGASTPATAVPTLSQWATIVVALILAALGAVSLRRRP